ncbi:hypothetical protein AAMO2058_000917400 [Amorphochlora amoebiformis]
MLLDSEKKSKEILEHKLKALQSNLNRTLKAQQKEESEKRESIHIRNEMEHQPHGCTNRASVERLERKLQFELEAHRERERALLEEKEMERGKLSAEMARLRDELTRYTAQLKAAEDAPEIEIDRSEIENKIRHLRAIEEEKRTLLIAVGSLTSERKELVRHREIEQAAQKELQDQLETSRIVVKRERQARARLETSLHKVKQDFESALQANDRKVRDQAHRENIDEKIFRPAESEADQAPMYVREPELEEKNGQSAITLDTQGVSEVKGVQWDLKYRKLQAEVRSRV